MFAIPLAEALHVCLGRRRVGASAAQAGFEEAARHAAQTVKGGIGVALGAECLQELEQGLDLGTAGIGSGPVALLGFLPQWQDDTRIPVNDRAAAAARSVWSQRAP